MEPEIITLDGNKDFSIFLDREPSSFMKFNILYQKIRMYMTNKYFMKKD